MTLQLIEYLPVYVADKNNMVFFIVIHTAVCHQGLWTVITYAFLWTKYDLSGVSNAEILYLSIYL